jgi:membrane protein YqaA with SNARE-associated domain
MKKIAAIFLFLFIIQSLLAQKPLRVGVAGLTHGHVGWILGYKKSDIVEVVGIAESNRELAEKLSKQYAWISFIRVWMKCWTKQNPKQSLPSILFFNI